MGQNHAILSASSSDRWLHCTPSAMAERAHQEKTSVYAAEGTLAHQVAEAMARTLLRDDAMSAEDGIELARSISAANELFKPEMLEYAEDYRDYIAEKLTDHAVLMLEQRLDFSQYVPDGFGTGDCIIVADNQLTIVDYKYGQGVPVTAEHNTQMMCYALGAINEYSMVYDFDRVRLCIYQPRIDNITEWEISVEELEQWAETTLKPRAALAAKGEGEMKAGKWCKFCKHAGCCPQLAESCTTFVSGLGGTKVPVKKLADHQLLEIWEQRSMITNWLDKVKAYIESQLQSGHGIEGLKLVEGKSSRVFTDQDAVEKILLDAGYAEKEYMAPATMLSVAQMEKALGKRKFSGLLGAYVTKEQGSPAIAFANDSRPDFDPAADFKILD